MGHIGFIHGPQMCRAMYHVITMMHLAKKYNVNPLIVTMLHLAITPHPISALFEFSQPCVKKVFFAGQLKSSSEGIHKSHTILSIALF